MNNISHKENQNSEVLHLQWLITTNNHIQWEGGRKVSQRINDGDWFNKLSFTLAPNSFENQFMETLDWRGQGIQNYGDNKMGEKGIQMLPELSPN